MREVSSTLTCAGCGRCYPILFGIPDLRLRPDRYLSLEEERAKAARLHAFGANNSFDALLRFYYSITEDVSPRHAAQFRVAIDAAPLRARKILARLAPPGEACALLDLGCGAGGTLVEATKRFRVCVGLDIGLRWLVIAQKRLAEAGVDAALVCADVEAPPFAPYSFSHVVAEDLLDHVRLPCVAAGAARDLVAPGGQLWITGGNRWWIGPHPAVGTWAAGLRPAWLRRAEANLRGRIDTLRHASFVSPRAIREVISRTLSVDALEPRMPPVLAADAKIGRSFTVGVYGMLARRPLARALLVAAGPAFQILAHRPPQQKGKTA